MYLKFDFQETRGLLIKCTADDTWRKKREHQLNSLVPPSLRQWWLPTPGGVGEVDSLAGHEAVDERGADAEGARAREGLHRGVVADSWDFQSKP